MKMSSTCYHTSMVWHIYSWCLLVHVTTSLRTSDTKVLAQEYSWFLLAHVTTASGISEIKVMVQPVYL